MINQIEDSLHSHSNYVNSVAVTHDGKIGSGSEDQTIRV